MIQNYLKTGMVFYDSKDKQHFGSKCCKETFYHFTDKTHFPSFQFFTNAVLGLPLSIAWRVFDLNGVDLGAWAADTPGIDTYHLIDNGYNISHDYRDVVTYPGIINYTDGYYLRLSIDTSAGVEYWYSEAFKVCNCDTEGAGDGKNLAENGWFEDWDGAADPANFPTGWARTGNNATNYVHDAGGKCQLISSIPLNPILILQNILTIGKWYVGTIEITDVTLGWIRIRNAGVTLVPYNTVGIKSFVFQAAGTDITIRENGACNITFTNVRVEEFVGFVFCDKITLNWWSDCNWDDIIYQFGYRNSLVLDKKDLDSPSEDIVINPEERQGEMFVRDVIIKKRYKFTIRIPEYLWNALIRLPAYGSEMPKFHSWIVLPDGSAAPMSELAIMGDWDTSNCMNTFTIDFVDDHEYPVVATNCCADDEYSEIEPEECEKDILSFFHTEERGEPLIVLMLIGHAAPQLFYYNEKTYGCWMQQTGVGYSVENMAYAVYHHYCNISVGYNIGVGTVSALDNHGFATLVVADDGHIVIAHEKLKNAGANGHNSMMYVKRSDNPEDETSWVHAIAHDEGWYVEVGNDTTVRLAYPSMDKMADGKIFLICRNSVASDLDHISVHRSDDNGVSWDAMGGDLDGGYEIVDMQYDASGEIMTYKGLCSHPSGNTVYMFFKVWDNDTDVQPDLYFLLSSDNGVTWESIDGVLSQDITAGPTAITKAQLDAGNGRVFNLPGAGSKIYHMSGVITDAGVPYLAVERATTAAPNLYLYIYYWDGGAWVGVNTTIPVSTTDLSGVVILERENKIEIIALTEEGAVWKWRVYRALKTDLTDWTIIETIGDTYDGTTSQWASFTFNYTETDCETLSYIHPTDINWSDFNVHYKC